jgi:putative ABC transport system ATP-binding protein
MEAVISIRNVNHYYGVGPLRRQVLFDVSADILPGEIVIVTGPSGSGKTTLLTLAGALRSVEDGSLQVLNHELRGAHAHELVRIRENIGFIFQAHNLLDALTARQNVQMALGVDARIADDEARSRSEETLRAVGLEQHFESHPSTLSGGQRQRVAIARALVRRPKIVLADEPTAALDRKTGREVVELIHAIAKKQDCAILMVTHDNRILDIADRVLTLEDGRMISFMAGIVANAGRMLSTFSQLQRKGELRRHVGAMSGKQFLDVLDHMTTEFDQLLRVIDLGNQEAVQALFDEMLEVVIIKIRQLLDADRGTVFLVAATEPVLTATSIHDKGELWSKWAEATATHPVKIRMQMTSGIAGRVAQTGETLNISDPYNHPDFNPEVDRKTGYRTASILCMPIFDRQRNIFAVAEILNKHGGPFTSEDEHAFREFAAPLGLILESCLKMTQRARAMA